MTITKKDSDRGDIQEEGSDEHGHVLPLSRIRSAFLRCASLCYSAAFASLLPQIGGLYGPGGVLPVKPFLRQRVAAPKLDLTDPMKFLENSRFNLLKFLPATLGLSVELTMDLLCLVGVVLSLVMALRTGWCHKLNFLVLWVTYKSLYEVGQTFLHFQWDILLLETGFLCVIVSPLITAKVPGLGGHSKTRPWDRVNMFLVRWLLFRMMFSSGVVKLLSRCDAWWGLTALPVHYESQCLPTWIAWYAHKFPDYFHKFSVVMTYFIEIPATFLFFAPTKELRAFTFWLQMSLMLTIMATGNYNFFNALYITLCLSLMDDTWLEGRQSKRESMIWDRLKRSFNRLVFVVITVATAFYFLKFDKAGQGWPSFVVNFDKTEFEHFVRTSGEASIGAGMVFLGIEATLAVWDSLRVPRSKVRKVFYLATTTLYVGVALVMFGISSPRYLMGMNCRTDPVPKPILQLSSKLDHLELTHSYGLFRRMTGVGGRPEVVIEGSTVSPNGPWEEFHFPYKPGNLSERPEIILPHQPRLDWQMWFAALGSFHHNPWFLSLVHRLAKGEPAVYNLLKKDSNIRFAQRPPKYVRALLYHYHFSDLNSSDWWWREQKEEYLPVTDVASLEEFLVKSGMLGSGGKYVKDESANKVLEDWLLRVRDLLGRLPHHLIVQTVFLAVIPIVLSLGINMRRW